MVCIWKIFGSPLPSIKNTALNVKSFCHSSGAQHSLACCNLLVYFFLFARLKKSTIVQTFVFVYHLTAEVMQYQSLFTKLKLSKQFSSYAQLYFQSRALIAYQSVKMNHLRRILTVVRAKNKKCNKSLTFSITVDVPNRSFADHLS